MLAESNNSGRSASIDQACSSSSSNAYSVSYRADRVGPNKFDFSKTLLNSVKRSEQTNRNGALRPQFKPKSTGENEKDREQQRRLDSAARKCVIRDASRCASLVIYSNDGMLVQHLVTEPHSQLTATSKGGPQNAYVNRCKKIQTIQKRKEMDYVAPVKTKTKPVTIRASVVNSNALTEAEFVRRRVHASAETRKCTRLAAPTARNGNSPEAEDFDDDYMTLSSSHILATDR